MILRREIGTEAGLHLGKLGYIDDDYSDNYYVSPMWLAQMYGTWQGANVADRGFLANYEQQYVYDKPSYYGMKGLGCVSAYNGIGALDLSTAALGGYLNDAMNGAKAWMTPTAIPSFVSGLTSMETGKMVATGVGLIVPPIVVWSLVSGLMRGGRRRRR